MSKRRNKRDWLSKASHAIAKKDSQHDLPPFAVWVRPAEGIGRNWYSVCYRVNDGPVAVVKNPLHLDAKTWDDYCRYQSKFSKNFRRKVEMPGRRFAPA